MNSLNKFETTGIIGSIVIMAIVLGVLRFQTNTLVAENTSTEDQGAVAVVSQEKPVSVLEETLRDAYSIRGELVKLVIEDVRLGTEGEPVKKGDTVEVHYVGTTQDGVKFDSSYDRGQTFIFTVGNGVVIKGWEEGLIGMKVGGQRILVIPSDMAYGNRQVGSIPPNTPLVFAVELRSIR